MSAARRKPSRSDVLEEFRTGSIHEAAMRVITRKGIAATTMSDVAAEAGISRPTLYLYFKDRNELVERTAALAVSGLLREVEQALRSPGTTEQRFRAVVLTHFRFFHERRAFFRVFLETCGEQRRTKQRKVYEQHLAEFAAFLSEGMDNGEVRRGDPRRLAVLIAEALGSVIRFGLGEPSSLDPAEEADWIATTLLRGLATEDKKS